MNDVRSGTRQPGQLTAETADEYARWFRVLGDGTRVRILNVLACADRPLTVGEIVDAVGKSQSTVSNHLRLLADEEYVFTEPDGVRTLISVNTSCMTALPEAAAVIMGVDIGAP
jgi:DNA-binding transcriptional ArsR family regulator